jgi:uncharacterized membrane protein
MSNETTGEGAAGVGMIIAAYSDEGAADAALDALEQAKRSGVLAFDDAAVIRRDADGKVSVKETGDLRTGKGAGIGALIGGVVGVLGGPMGVALGAGAGAAIGGVAAHSDAGFDNQTLARIGGALPASTSALAATTSRGFVEAVREAATDEETLTFAQTIADEISNDLSAGQDVLMALLLTEDGVAASKVISSPEELAVFGIAITDEGAALGAAVATDEGVAATGAKVSPVEDDAEFAEDSDSEGDQS